MKLAAVLIAFFLTTSLLLSTVVYPEETTTAEDKEREMAKKPMAWDLGPDTVDISDYTAEMQSYYKVFAQKCGKCHTIARALNSPYATPEEWNNYVNKMMRKPGSGIGPHEGKQIFQFLVYDSKVRKLSNPAVWQKHIQELLAAFREKYGKELGVP